MPPDSRLTIAQIRHLAALVAPAPVEHGRASAVLLVSDTSDGLAQQSIDPVAKLRVTVPTKWVPPEQDEDGYLSPLHSPYDRDLILSPPANGPAATLHLLDLVSVPELPCNRTPSLGPQASGAFAIQRRQVFSTTGQSALMLTGGDILRFAVRLVNGATQIGAKFSFEEVTIDDREAFEGFQECDVHIDFVFRHFGLAQLS